MKWVYCRDEHLALEWRWDKQDSRIRIIDGRLGAVVNETGVNLSRVFRYYLNCVKG